MDVLLQADADVILPQQFDVWQQEMTATAFVPARHGWTRWSRFAESSAFSMESHMRKILFGAFALMIPAVLSSQTQPPSLPLGQGRPEVPGITRTTLKDDAKSTVTRVRFAPGAGEPPHIHPNDVIIVPVTSGPVDVGVGDRTLTSLKAGDVQFVAHDVVHHVKNTGTEPFELIAIALK